MSIRLLCCSAALIIAVGPRSATSARASSAGRPSSVAGLRQAEDTIVRIAGRPRHPNGATLVHELTIGSADGTEEYNLTSIGDVVVAQDGSIIVVDHGVVPGGTPFVRQYDASGKFVRTIGRKGEGPGEYMSPSGLIQLRDGRIVLRDGAQSRMNLYTPSGEPSGTWRLDRGARGFGMTNSLLVDTAGTIYRREGIGPEAGRAPPQALVRMHADGTVIDTVPPPELPTHPFPVLRARSGAGGRGWFVPYAPSSIWAWSPLGYAVTGRTDRYAIDLRIPTPRSGGSGARRVVPPLWKAGDPVVSIRRDARPIPISEAERTARRRAVEAFLRVVDPKWSWSGPEIPRTKPFFRFLDVARDGRIWVMVSVPSERFSPEPTRNVTGRGDGGVPFREPTVYEVFEPTGAFLGQVRVPYRARLVVMDAETVWAVVNDADDVETLQRFRIAWK